jgi:flagellar biosynthesis/type III secretory pathway M-ring protein FliF/YscJ
MDIGLAILIGIAVLLIMIYLSTRSIVEVLNHWGKRNDDDQGQIIEKLERMK